MRPETKAEVVAEAGSLPQVPRDKSSRFIIDAAIVRIMKKDGISEVVSHTQLVSRVILSVSEICQVPHSNVRIVDIKKRIENLIERGYIYRERTDDGKAGYKYIP